MLLCPFLALQILCLSLLSTDNSLLHESLQLPVRFKEPTQKHEKPQEEKRITKEQVGKLTLDRAMSFEKS